MNIGFKQKGNYMNKNHILSETVTPAFVYRNKDGNFLNKNPDWDGNYTFDGVATYFDSKEAKDMDKVIKLDKIACTKHKVKIIHTVVIEETK
jgi:hypothetical protein